MEGNLSGEVSQRTVESQRYRPGRRTKAREGRGNKVRARAMALTACVFRVSETNLPQVEKYVLCSTKKWSIATQLSKLL